MKYETDSSPLETGKHLNDTMSSQTNKSSPAAIAELNLTSHDTKAPAVVELKKSIGLFNGVTLIVGIIIGSGIFITPGGVLVNSGSVGFSLIVWALSGIFSMLGALSFAELGTTIKRSGGDYAYIITAFGRLTGFVYLWINIIVARPLLLAISSLSFGYYITKPFFNLEDNYGKQSFGFQNDTSCLNKYGANNYEDIKSLNTRRADEAARICAALGLMLLMAINCYSVKLAMKIQDIFTSAKLLALGVIIVCGAVKLGQGNTQNFQNMFAGTGSVKDISLAFYSGLFSYAGWNFLNFVTGELKNPTRNLPLAIVIAMPIVTIVYLLTNIAYLSVLAPAIIKTSKAVAFDFSLNIDPRLAWVMPFVVALSAIGSANGILFTSGRILVIGAQERQLPELLAMVNITALTPLPAIFLLGTLSMFYLVGKDLDMLISFFSFIFFFFIGLCIFALIYLRFKQKCLERPIKFNILIHIFCLAVCLFLTVSSIIAKPKDIGITGAICLATAFPVYYSTTLKLKSKKFLVSIWIFFQKLLYVTSVDKVE